MTFADLTPPYSTIVADPPWHYAQRMTMDHPDCTTPIASPLRSKASAADRYSTLGPAEVAALPVVDLAADDAHLYLWTTTTHLFDARAVMEAWGFEYRTLLTWVKRGSLGLGFYFRIDTEHLLFGTRGSLPIPPDRRVRNWFEAPKTGHSRKPAAFGDLVEQVSPGPYVELFARQPRLGWDAWGHGYEIGAAS